MTDSPPDSVSAAEPLCTHVKDHPGLGPPNSLKTSGPPGAVDQEFDSEFAYIVLLVLLLVLCCGLFHACVDRPQEVPQLPEA